MIKKISDKQKLRIKIRWLEQENKILWDKLALCPKLFKDNKEEKQ